MACCCSLILSEFLESIFHTYFYLYCLVNDVYLCFMISLMTMMTEGITFATVFDAIEHYQKVKSQQEETLRELRQKRSKLADALDVSMVERELAASRRSKTTETLKMVQHRVTQSQTQLAVLRETSERGREAVERFHHEVIVIVIVRIQCLYMLPPTERLVAHLALAKDNLTHCNG